MTIIQGDELRTRGVTDLRTALSLTDRRPHLSRILEAGLLDFEQIDYTNIPKRRRAGFRRKVKARYGSLLRAIP